MESELNRSEIRVAHITTVDLTLRFLLLGQLKRLREEGYNVTAISAAGPWVNDIEAAGIHHIRWKNATRSWAPLRDTRAFFELVRLLKRERFDLLHTHNPKPGFLGRVAARIVGIPCVVNTVHGLYTTPEDPLIKRSVVLAMERIAASASDVELYQSREDLEWATARGVIDPERSLWIGNGTDLRYFDPEAVSQDDLIRLRRELGIDPETRVVGTMGRIVAEKGYREFFAASALVRERLGDVVFVAVGAPDPDKSDSLADSDIKAANVIATGWRRDVRELLALMDVFVLASWREGVPRSAIEAAAMARPLILSNVRGCREVVTAPDEGVLVPPRDAESLAQAIMDLLKDQGRRAFLARNARRLALEKFDEGRVEQQIVAVYQHLLARKGLIPSRKGEVTIRRARREDARTLSSLHRRNLTDAFLSTLGERFLTQLYLELIAYAGGAVFIAEHERRPVGFISGVVSVRDFYRRFFLRRGIIGVLSAIPKLIAPEVMKKVRETARYPKARAVSDAELLAIAVDERSRRSGAAGMLTRALLETMGARGAKEIQVVVGEDNEPANRFYETFGFRLAAKIEIHEGTTSNVWTIRCPTSSLRSSPSS